MHITGKAVVQLVSESSIVVVVSHHPDHLKCKIGGPGTLCGLGAPAIKSGGLL